jgi:hypothetical protein
MFANGLNTTTLTKGSNFTVSVNIFNSPPIDFFSIGIQWNPAVLELGGDGYAYNDSYADIWTGTTPSTNFFNKTAGAYLFANVASDEIFYSNGSLDGIAGCYTVAGVNSSGSGTLFYMEFHCMAPGISEINLTTINGLYTWLTCEGVAVTIAAGYNARVASHTSTTAPNNNNRPMLHSVWSRILYREVPKKTSDAHRLQLLVKRALLGCCFLACAHWGS